MSRIRKMDSAVMTASPGDVTLHDGGERCCLHNTVSCREFFSPLRLAVRRCILKITRGHEPPQPSCTPHHYGLLFHAHGVASPHWRRLFLPQPTERLRIPHLHITPSQRSPSILQAGHKSTVPFRSVRRVPGHRALWGGEIRLKSQVTGRFWTFGALDFPRCEYIISLRRSQVTSCGEPFEMAQ